MRDRIKKSILLISIGIVVNIALAAIKMYVGLASNSLCIMLDAMNSFLDTLTCIVTLIVFIVLLLPKGENAPYGYGRGEYLAGFIVAVVSVVMGGLFFVRSLNRMAMPEPVYYGWQSIVLISVCLPIKLGIGLAYMFANKKIRSQAVRALMLDSFLDMGITATSLVAFAITARVDYAVDAIVGIVMSVVIIAVGIKMVVENVRAIVVGDGAKDEIAAIEDACKSQNAVLVKTELHDYGYGAKVGNAFVSASENTDFAAMSAEVKEKTNASVTFIAISADKENENGNRFENKNDDKNGNRADNQYEIKNENTDGEGGNATENEGESEHPSIENNEK